MRSLLTFSLALCASGILTNVHAQSPIQVQEPWVRATVAQQKVSGAFMQLQSHEDTRLVAVQSPAAERVEMHEMKLENDVMRMRAVQGIDLTAGKPLELQPGGYHLMLMGLRQPLITGTNVTFTLEFENRQGQRYQIPVQAPVRSLAGKTAVPPAGAHGGHGAHGAGH